MGERVGVMIYSIWVEEESGKGPYGREGWSRDIQYMGGGRIRERAVWERGLGRDIQYMVGGKIRERAV